MAEIRSAQRGLATLVGAGVVALLGYLVPALAHRAGAPIEVYYGALVVGTGAMLVGARAVRRVPAARVLPVVAVVAVVCRIALLPTTPELSNDLYRYLWDGTVQQAGINPYTYAPKAPELEFLRDEQVWPNINRKSKPTIYPPTSEVVFAVARLVGIARPVTLKAVFVAVDLAAVWLLLRIMRRARRDERLLLLYAWNPLPVLAFAHSGHVDVLAVLGLLATVAAWQQRHERRAGLWAGLAAGVKLYPALVLPAFVRRRAGVAARIDAAPDAASPSRLSFATPAVAVAVLLALYLPYLIGEGSGVLGYLTTGGYLKEEGYVTGNRFSLASALGVNGFAFAVVVGLGVAAWACWSRRPAPAKAAALLGAALMLTTPYPWYATPLVALAVAGGSGVVASGPDGTTRPWVAELVWPLFGIGLELVYISVEHPYGVSLSLQRAVLACTTLVALVLIAFRARTHERRSSPPTRTLA